METEKKTSSFKIRSSLFYQLLMISRMKEITMSDIIEGLVRDYVVINKHEMIEFLQKIKENDYVNF